MRLTLEESAERLKEAGLEGDLIETLGKELELPPWLFLPTDDYDAELVVAQDAVSRMSGQEKMEAMQQIARVFNKRHK